ncbi:DEKNAAC104633 [Brettanomyces naardenensis]|uniref:Signal recognition particle receptor subunit beta n=1 Tax=Brettanomyces naardenensis TaxID=13370 RepID=A0A448YRD8_BRENA|nr:DEKNAAC104633 [Brettanomyces naardenensis]
MSSISDRLAELRKQDGLMFFASVALALFVIILTSFIVQRSFLKSKKRNILILGPKESGKTNLFYYVTTGKLPVLTVTSIEPNTGTLKLRHTPFGENFSDVVIRDFPASSKLKNLYLYPFLKDNLHSCRGIVYVIDSSIFSGEYCNKVANDLLDLLQITESIPNGVDIALFCNKCDYFTSRKPEKVQTMLEEEITKLYRLKLKNLSKVTKPGEEEEAQDEDGLEEVLNSAFNRGEFKFEMLEANIDFLEGNVFKGNTEQLTNWFCEKAAN